ncbi:MAG: hypothetical protein Kow0070_05840 [Anaerolineales bacterium]
MDFNVSDKQADENLVVRAGDETLFAIANSIYGKFSSSKLSLIADRVYGDNLKVSQIECKTLEIIFIIVIL